MIYNVTITWLKGASIKVGPNTGGDPVGSFPAGAKFQASEIVPDSTDAGNPLKLWAKIAGGQYNGKYVAVSYPSSSGVALRATWVVVSDTTPPPTVFPESFTLVAPDGAKANYIFDKVL